MVANEKKKNRKMNLANDKKTRIRQHAWHIHWSMHKFNTRHWYVHHICNCGVLI